MNARPHASAAIAWLLACGGCANVDVVEPAAHDAYDACSDPDWATAQRSIANGDVDAALVLLPRVVSACPDFVPAHVEWVRLARQRGGAAETAMRAYYAALPDRLQSPVLPYVRSRLDDVDSRRDDLLNQSISRDASFYFAYLDLAEIWGRNDRIAKQFEFLEKAVQAKPNWPEANLGIARVLVSLGRGEEAIAHFEVYARARPDDRVAIKELVRLLLYDVGKLDSAAEWVEQLRMLAPDDPATQMDEAALAWLRGDRERSAAMYRRVLEVDPMNARAALNLGNLWFGGPERNDAAGKQVDWPRARQAYRYFLALGSAADVHDLRDLMVSVPYRLQVIDALLGRLPDGAPPARLGEF